MSAPDRQLNFDTQTRRTVLIVDDEPLVALHLADVAEDAEWAVLGPASSGAEAIALAMQTRPDLALIDVNIAGDQDGVTVAETLSSQLGVKVVLISGYPDLASEERVRALEPLAVLSKPCAPSEIENLLHAVGRTE